MSGVSQGVGGIFVSAAPVFLLAYFDLLSAADADRPQVRQGLLAVTVPLGIVFGGTVLSKSVQVARAGLADG